MKKKKANRGKLEHYLFNSLLFDTWRKVRDKKLTLLFTMLLDMGFLASLAVLNWIWLVVFPNPQNIVTDAGAMMVFALLVLLGYLFLIIATYSSIKLIVMSRVKSLFGKSKAISRVDFRHYGNFLSINIVIFGMYMILLLFFTVIFLTSIKIPAFDVLRNAFLVLIGFFLYLSVNTAHSLFEQGVHCIKKLLRMTADLVFNRLKIYAGLVVFTLVVCLLFAAGYYLLDWIVLSILGSAMGSRLVYVIYAVVNTVIVFILAFGLLAFNRVYFYNITKNL
jgi:hypothetical protein